MPGVNFVIAVTDRGWLETLRQQPDLSEVNFWSPSPKGFQALQPGELFFFKPHRSDVIVGGGIFAWASKKMSCSLAWETFREMNGARSEEEMRMRIARYRRINREDKGDFEIGCRILVQPFFLDEPNWIPVPKSWSPNIVVLKTYSTTEHEGRLVWEAVSRYLKFPQFSDEGEDPIRFGNPTLIRPRLGQGAFRILVTDIYHRRCAITRERTLPALDAAHIQPYSKGGVHEASNELLLRRDLHSLFDAGYLTVTPKLKLEVSQRIREEFENGRDYYALHGHQIDVPDDIHNKPNPTALNWHNENCYRG